MLGKRKRETAVARRIQPEDTETSAQGHVNDNADDVFRKYFEAAFDPLPQTDRILPFQVDRDDDKLESDDLQSEWSGISDEVAEQVQVEVVEVVDLTATGHARNVDQIDTIFMKSVKSSRPPRMEIQGDSQQPSAGSKTSSSSRVKNEEDEAAETMNLKHDLDLQRLLRESHLLEQAKARPNGGTQRHKATDMRLQALGSKSSLFTQEKMPMSHRNGILAKATSRENLRRKEAKENGIILEKPSAQRRAVSDARRRTRGVDVPVVGRFKGGTLQLSRKDVASIQGPRNAKLGKRGRR